MADDHGVERRRPPTERQRGLIRDLADVGVLVGDVWELANWARPYPSATPVLMAWLSRIDDMRPADDAREKLREGLIRALSTRAARPVAGPLMVRQFRTTPLDNTRWAAGNAISVVAGPAVFTDVADLVREQSYGVARQMPVAALGRIGGRPNRGAVTEILIDLLADDDVVLHAISAVRRLRAAEARPAMERLLSHDRESVRRRAQAALPSLR